MAKIILLWACFLFASVQQALGNETRELRELREIKLSILRLDMAVSVCTLELLLKKEGGEGCAEYGDAISSPANPVAMLQSFMTKMNNRQVNTTPDVQRELLDVKKLLEEHVKKIQVLEEYAQQGPNQR
jgi:hypothetical protein